MLSPDTSDAELAHSRETTRGFERDVERCIAGIRVAHRLLFDRIPSRDLRGPRVSGSGDWTGAPRPDFEVRKRYEDAQRAARQAYLRARVFGAPPAAWPQRHARAPRLEHWRVLVTALVAIRAAWPRMPEGYRLLVAADLRACAKRLEPFWRTPVQPPAPATCASCRRRHARTGRTTCEACKRARTRKRARSRAK